MKVLEQLLHRAPQPARLRSGALGVAIAVAAPVLNPHGAAIWTVPFTLAELVRMPHIPNPEWLSPGPADAPSLFVAMVLAGVVLADQEADQEADQRDQRRRPRLLLHAFARSQQEHEAQQQQGQADERLEQAHPARRQTQCDPPPPAMPRIQQHPGDVDADRRQQRDAGVGHAGARAVVEQELGPLKALGQLLPDRLLDHPGAGKADERARLRDVDVAQHRVRCRDPASGRVGQDHDVGQARLAQHLDRDRGAWHLHERHDAFLHARTTRGHKENEGRPELNGP